MSKQKMIKVPFMKMPECCDKCDFGRLRFSHPSWSKDEKVGKHGYNCQLEYYEKGRYETVREAPIDEHIVPVLCPLIKANKELNPNCDILKPRTNSMMTDDEIKKNCFIPLSQYRIDKQLKEDTKRRTKRQQYNHEYYLKVLKPKRQKQRELKGEQK